MLRKEKLTRDGIGRRRWSKKNYLKKKYSIFEGGSKGLKKGLGVVGLEENDEDSSWAIDSNDFLE